MALPPQKFREIVFQILFSYEFDREESDETALLLMKELQVTKRSVLEARNRARAIFSLQEQIDSVIRSVSNEYQFDRISSAEKCALRLGCFEILHDPALSGKIAIAEAIRLTRKFGTPSSADFVNALLDIIYKNSHAPELAKPSIPS